MTEKVIVVEDLVKRYGDVVAVNKISFDVYRGEIFSFVGPNGAGKTTTVEILECLRKPTSGTARVLGYDIFTEDKEIKKRIGVMPQDFNAFDRLTVKENIELIARIYRTKADMPTLLEILGLHESRNKKFYQLSGGMKRRVGIGMALVSDPEILFLDEPTTGLDPKARRDCWDILYELRKSGKTIFLTTHYMEEVEKLSDRTSIIMNGKIIAIDNVTNLISKYGGGITLVVKGNGDVQQIISEFGDNITVDEHGYVIGKFSDRKDIAKALTRLYQFNEDYGIDIREPSMDDVFLNLVGGKIDERGEVI